MPPKTAPPRPSRVARQPRPRLISSERSNCNIASSYHSAGTLSEDASAASSGPPCQLLLCGTSHTGSRPRVQLTTKTPGGCCWGLWKCTPRNGKCSVRKEQRSPVWRMLAWENLNWIGLPTNPHQFRPPPPRTVRGALLQLTHLRTYYQSPFGKVTEVLMPHPLTEATFAAVKSFLHILKPKGRGGSPVAQYPSFLVQ